MAKAKPIPDGYHTATPYLIVNDGARALDYYKRALNAKELMRIPRPDGKVGHAEIKIGDSIIMLADEMPDMDAHSPAKYGGSPVSLLLYVEDVDKQFAQAVSAGGTQVRPVTDMFYGDRSGCVKDPFGHSWHISTHKEGVPPEELNRRMAEMAKQHEMAGHKK